MKPTPIPPNDERRLRRQRQIGAALLLVTLLLVSYFWWHESSLAQPERSHPMTDLTANMKTMCIGRYLIDVPAEAEVSLGNAESDSNVIESIPVFPHQQAYEQKLRDREAELRAAPHKTDGSLLKSVIKSSDGKQVVFVSRPEADDEFMYLVESFVYLAPAAWWVHFQTNDEYLRETTKQVAAIAQGLRYREPNSIPVGKGGCLGEGLLDHVPQSAETYYGGARIQSKSWSLSITSETSGPRDNVNFKDLFRRVDDAIAMAGAGSGIEKLRRAVVETDGRKGQEYVGLYPDEHAIIFDAKLELYGDSTPQKPTIKLLMESGWPKKKHPDDPRTFLTEQESMAVWDAVVKSIRPRPGAF